MPLPSPMYPKCRNKCFTIFLLHPEDSDFWSLFLNVSWMLKQVDSPFLSVCCAHHLWLGLLAERVLFHLKAGKLAGVEKVHIPGPIEKFTCSGSGQSDQKSNGTEDINDSVSLYPEYVHPLCCLSLNLMQVCQCSMSFYPRWLGFNVSFSLYPQCRGVSDFLSMYPWYIRM